MYRPQSFRLSFRDNAREGVYYIIYCTDVRTFLFLPATPRNTASTSSYHYRREKTAKYVINTQVYKYKTIARHSLDSSRLEALRRGTWSLLPSSALLYICLVVWEVTLTSTGLLLLVCWCLCHAISSVGRSFIVRVMINVPWFWAMLRGLGSPFVHIDT